MPFEKGQSGNPGGLSKNQKDASRKLRNSIANAADRIGEVYTEALNSEDERIRWEAAKYGYDRLLGKATQSINQTVSVDVRAQIFKALKLANDEDITVIEGSTNGDSSQSNGRLARADAPALEAPEAAE